MMSDIQRYTIIQKVALEMGYTPKEIKDWFFEFCADTECLYYKSGHLWVLTIDSDVYKDWSMEYYKIK